jgi:hypothetical protein
VSPLGNVAQTNFAGQAMMPSKQIELLRLKWLGEVVTWGLIGSWLTFAVGVVVFSLMVR